MSDAAKLVVDGTVAQANPALIGADVRCRDAAQVSANGRDDKHLRGAGVRQDVDVLLVEMAGLGQRVRLGDLAKRQTADEDQLTVPGGLHDLAGRQLTNVDLLVRVSEVARPRNHLVVNDRNDRLDAERITGEDEALQHVDLCALDLVVPVLLVPESILIEPVISLGLRVERVTKLLGRDDVTQ